MTVTIDGLTLLLQDRQVNTGVLLPPEDGRTLATEL